MDQCTVPIVIERVNDMYKIEEVRDSSLYKPSIGECLHFNHRYTKELPVGTVLRVDEVRSSVEHALHIMKVLTTPNEYIVTVPKGSKVTIKEV